MLKENLVIKNKEILKNMIFLANLYGECLEEYMQECAKYMNVENLESIIRAVTELYNEKSITKEDSDIIILYYISCDWIDDFNSIYTYSDSDFKLSKSSFTLYSLILDNLETNIKTYSMAVVSKTVSGWRFDKCNTKVHY